MSCTLRLEFSETSRVGWVSGTLGYWNIFTSLVNQVVSSLCNNNHKGVYRTFTESTKNNFDGSDTPLVARRGGGEVIWLYILTCVLSSSFYLLTKITEHYNWKEILTLRRVNTVQRPRLCYRHETEVSSILSFFFEKTSKLKKKRWTLSLGQDLEQSTKLNIQEGKSVPYRKTIGISFNRSTNI